MSARKRILECIGFQETAVLIIGCGTLLGMIAGSAAPATEAGGFEFFEKRIRPVLAENCHQCHSHKAEKLKAGLYLDSREGLLRGGESGEVVVPRQPNQSRLIEAVRYADLDLQMPPKKKLPDTIIADLIEWVKIGAPWPEEPATGLAKSKAADSEADTQAFLNERRKHWAYQPVRSVAIPAVKNPAWCASEIDSFILAKLEENSLPPASPADRRTLIRRATYDLIGLPPTRGEVDEFLRDSSQDAFAKVVDRLLASPHYGERWARHWLDLIRFSETLGFEFDFDLYNSWRYRDYVIRAFNTDLPYNQFVVEHIAGDLVPQPRRDPIGRFNESIVATGFFWMGEGRQTPVDIRQEQADIIDGQIDVLGKAFLAQTIACARCHDHKFDAITTQDYYALAGYLKSSRYQQAFIDPPDRIAAKARELAVLKKRIRDLVAGELAATWVEQTARSSRYLLAAQRMMNGARVEGSGSKGMAQEFGLDEAQLERWVKALQQKEVNSANHPLYAWVQLGYNKESKADEFLQQRNALLAALREQMDKAARAAKSAQVYEDFHRAGYEGWYATGAAFDAGPGQPGDIILGDQRDRPVGEFVSRGAHSGLLSTRLQGELRSQTFTITKPFIHWLVAGKNARVNLIIDGYTLIMNPMYGGLTIAATNEHPAWRTMAADRWIGHRAYFEICDSTVPMHRLNPPPSTARVPEGPAEGYALVKQICFSDEGTPPAEAPNRFNIQALDQAGCENAAALAEAYQRLMAQELERWRSGETADKSDHEEGTRLLNWLLQNGLLEKPARSGDLLQSVIPNPKSEIDQLAGLMNQYRAIELTLRSPLRTPALADGTGEDESVFVRGNYRTLGKPVTRRPPEVFASTQFSPSPPEKERRAVGTNQGPPHPNPVATAQSEGEEQDRLAGRSKHLIPPVTGSGRLELARHLVDPSNPLIARVMVNRIWQHHFGEGIVRTPDDFGRMGQPPTHPELLDYLAGEFVRRGWSLKAMHRLMMLTSAYKMSSKVDPAQIERDPENRWLSHMPVRRLEAEAIRDAILAISGRLNRTTYGPSTLPYLTPYMEGRGRPNSGPLDGDGRRSIYTNARRNFPVPMLVAFDFPVHFSTHGRREVSAVPEQAMTLMNDPFVAQQARRWAARALAEPSRTPEQRIDGLYQTAFSRPPSAMELSHALLFLEHQAKRHGGNFNDPKAWADLCHVLINVKEFIFVN